MKQPELDWSVLRGATILLILTVLISGGIAWASYFFNEDMRRQFESDNRRFHSQSQRYLTVDEEEQNIINYLPRFDELARQGIIGDEQRLNWDETLRHISREMKLPSLRYSISPQETYEAHHELNSGSYDVKVSRMTLTMGMLHEGDLPVLLDKLRSVARGYFTVEECSMKRSGPEIKRSPKAVNLNLECELSWITLRKPEEIL